MLVDAQALAIRRAAAAAAIVLATLGAHHAATGHTGASASAPALWAGWVAIAALVGPRAGRFRPRGPVVTGVLLLAGQVAGHSVLWHAPWALGLTGMAAGPALDAAALTAHALAAVALTVLLTGLDAALAMACTLTRALARLLRRPAVVGAAPAVRVGDGTGARADRRPGRPWRPRGPPRPVPC